MRAMLDEASKGRVRVWDLARSVAAMRLPTGEYRMVFSATTALPPRYGAPSRFWKRKFMAERRSPSSSFSAKGRPEQGLKP